MKMFSMTNQGRWYLVMAGVAAVLWAAQAGEAVSGKGGASRLMQGASRSKMSPVIQAKNSESVPPSNALVCKGCSECETLVAKRVEKNFKGHQDRVLIVQEHGCPGCETLVKVEGHGKAKVRRIEHVCRHCPSGVEK